MQQNEIIRVRFHRVPDGLSKCLYRVTKSNPYSLLALFMHILAKRGNIDWDVLAVHHKTAA